jgi:hypothetical protein
MSLPTWLRPLANLVGRPTKGRPRSACLPQRHTARPRLELLEDRAVPAVGFGSAFAASPPLDNPLGASDGLAIAIDLLGNSYVAGYFGGTVDFDPGAAHPDDADILSGGTYIDGSGQTIYANYAFVAKYQPDGSLAWVRGFGTPDAMPEECQGVAVDDAGNVYVVGGFADTVDFGGHVLTADGESDGFTAKLDAAGNVVWANRVGGADRDSLHGVAVHTAADGSVGVYAASDGVVFKWDADGVLAWSREVGGTSAAGVAVDGAGNAYVTGQFRGSVDFDPGPGTYKLSSGGRGKQVSPAAYVLKLDADGAFGWARHFQADRYSASYGEAVAVHTAADGSVSVYTAGTFYGTVDFDPGTGRKEVHELTSAGSADVYVSRLTADGSLAWVRQVGGTDMDRVWGLAVDSAGAAYLSGNFAGTVDFDPGAGTHELTSSGSYDAYVAKLDSDGSFAWAVSPGATGADVANALAVDSSGNVRVTGSFSGTADFDPGPGEYLLDSEFTSMFLWTLTQQP